MSGRGKVYLVGAGPGDPELLTVKAQRLLRDCDVVVYDRLVSAAILDQVPPGVTRINAGKAPGRHTMTQGQISALLVRLARAGYQVVRLKGGDPFVFGRGSEEARELARHRVAFEVVPGITAAAGASAYAGIPLTHRGLAHGVRLVTGHRQDGAPLDLDWSCLADPAATLVIYMGLGHVEEIVRQLVAHGLSPRTPAAAIQDGTLPGQRRCLTTLGELAGTVRAAGLRPPVTLVIGRVVSLAPELDWFTGAAAAGAEESHG